MKIDENTKVIGRFHTKPSPRGLNIYNPFFEEAGINAVYLLFYNSDPQPLIDGLRKFNLAGAITAGFESDEKLPRLLDELNDTAKYIQRVGFVANKDGKVTGYSQNGPGLLRAIDNVVETAGKKIVIVGGGNVAKALLFNINKRGKLPEEVEIYNRTVEKAKKIAQDFSFVKKVGSLVELKSASGDLLVNATNIGGSIPDEIYTKAVVDRYSIIADVTFETEGTNLINLARKLGKKHITGWDMFTYQGQIILETILGVPVSAEILKRHVVRGLSEVVK